MRITRAVLVTVHEYVNKISPTLVDLYIRQPNDPVTLPPYMVNREVFTATAMACGYLLGIARGILGDGKPFPQEIEAIRDEIHGRGDEPASAFIDGKRAGFRLATTKPRV